MSTIAGKIAIVTGASSGIGRACAEALALEGAVVIVTDVNDDAGRAAATTIGGTSSFLHLDVTREEAWVDAVAHVERAYGRLDILVNNAGIAFGCPSIVDMTLADWRRMQAVNVEGVFLGTKHALPLMRRAGNGGSIINMSSGGGLKGHPAMAAYCATKGAVRLFTKAIALECAAARDGIRVNSVHPGVIQTPIWEGFANLMTGGKAAGAPDLDALSATLVPLGVKGLPIDVANGVVWLASDQARYVTGAELVIDGGATIV